jgi:hypothetical protein
MSYVALANITLGSSASSVTFSSIPASFRDLVLVFNGTGSGTTGNLRMTFNGSTLSNFSDVRMYNFNNSSGSDTTGGDSLVSLGSLNNRQASVVNIMDYSATDKHKTYLFRGGAPAVGSGASANRWASTAAITSIVLINTAGTLDAGSTFALYGIRS